MGKTVGHGHPARLALQRVVTNARGSVHRLGDVTRLDRTDLILRRARPYSGETISLQFDAHGKRVGLRLRALRAQLINLA